MSALGELAYAVLTHRAQLGLSDKHVSMAELGLEASLVVELTETLCASSPRELDAYLGSGTPCPSHGSGGAFVHDLLCRDAAVGLVLLTVAAERARAHASPGEVWASFSELTFRYPAARALLLTSTGQPTSAMKNSLARACGDLRLRRAPPSVAQPWYLTVALHAGLHEGDPEVVLGWLAGSPPLAIQWLQTDTQLRSDSFVKLWTALGRLASAGSSPLAADTAVVRGSPWLRAPDRVLAAIDRAARGTRSAAPPTTRPKPAPAEPRASEAPRRVEELSLRLVGDELRLAVTLDLVGLSSDRVDVVSQMEHVARFVRRGDGTYTQANGERTFQLTLSVPLELSLVTPEADVEVLELDALMPTPGEPRYFVRAAGAEPRYRPAQLPSVGPGFGPRVAPRAKGAALVLEDDLSDMPATLAEAERQRGVTAWAGGAAWLEPVDLPDASPETSHEPLALRPPDRLERGGRERPVVLEWSDSASPDVARSIAAVHVGRRTFRAERCEGEGEREGRRGVRVELDVRASEARDPLHVRVAVESGPRLRARLAHALEGATIPAGQLRAAHGRSAGVAWVDPQLALDASAPFSRSVRGLPRADGARLAALDLFTSRLDRPAIVLDEAPRLGEALALRYRDGAPTFVTRSLVDHGLCDPTTTTSSSLGLRAPLELDARHALWALRRDGEVVSLPFARVSTSTVGAELAPVRAVALAYGGRWLGAHWAPDWHAGLLELEPARHARLLLALRWMRLPLLATEAHETVRALLLRDLPGALDALLTRWSSLVEGAAPEGWTSADDLPRLERALRALLADTPLMLPANVHRRLTLGFEREKSPAANAPAESFFYGHVVSRLLRVSSELAEAFVATTDAGIARQLSRQLGLRAQSSLDKRAQKRRVRELEQTAAGEAGVRIESPADLDRWLDAERFDEQHVDSARRARFVRRLARAWP